MKKGFDTFSLHIKKYTPDTLPFKRLMEYLVQLQKLFEGEKVHFVRVAKGSAAPEFIIRNEDAYRIEAKINSLSDFNNQTYSKIKKLLQEDESDAYFTKNNKRIFEIKYANDNIQKYDIKQDEEILGYVIKVGGKDDTVPLCICDLYDETITYNCNTTRDLAKSIARYLFETPVKITGKANWIKIGNSNWELKSFNVKSFDVIQNNQQDDYHKLFEIDEEWYKNHTVEEFMKEIRGEDE